MVDPGAYPFDIVGCRIGNFPADEKGAFRPDSGGIKICHNAYRITVKRLPCLVSAEKIRSSRQSFFKLDSDFLLRFCHLLSFPDST
jgi:hypothetical protein